MAGRDTAVRDLADLVQASHMATPDVLPELILQQARSLGADDVVLYLVDYEQRVLVPVPPLDGPVREELLIDSTLAGRSYRTIEVHESAAEDGRRRLWAPVLDGVERLGVLELQFPPEVTVPLDEVRAFAGLVAEVVMTKRSYGDIFEFVRRRRPMSLAAELAWQLLPPLTFGTEQLVISGVLAPVYELGGDSFDYSVETPAPLGSLSSTPWATASKPGCWPAWR